MGDDPSAPLVVGVCAAALFDLRAEQEVLRTRGVEAYRQYLRDRQGDPLAEGSGLGLCQALLALNEGSRCRVELVVISTGPADSSLRFFASVQEHGLAIERAAFTGGRPLGPYLAAFHVDLFVAPDPADVSAALEAGTAAAHSCSPSTDGFDPICIALDGDAQLLLEEAAQAGSDTGPAGDDSHPDAGAGPGPFQRCARALARLQADLDPEQAPIRTALLTSRSRPGPERVLAALGRWGLRLDEAFFLGDLPKHEVLRAFGPHLLLGAASAPSQAMSTAEPTPLVRTDVAEVTDEREEKPEEEPHTLASPFGRMRFRSNDRP
jgi:5'-nucleotidase